MKPELVLVRRNARRIGFGLAAGALSLVSMASAQTGDWDIGDATTTQTGLLAAGVLLVIGLVVFKLGKRAANKI